MKRKENFQLLPKELHQLKYEAISVPQDLVRLVKKTQERKSSTCYLLITKGVTSSSPVPLKTRRAGKTEGNRSKKTRAGCLWEDPRVLDRDADDESWTRIRENALRTVRRQAVEKATSKRAYHTG
ncbi:uncharacterized protein TNCV_2442011 [Trichonephila clavipes]|nr:uncharacterized protein TNCV_2442011 [Trichonephila clavipes]